MMSALNFQTSACILNVQVSLKSNETVEPSVCKLVLKSAGLRVLASKRNLFHECWTSMIEIGKVGRNHQIEFVLDTMVTRMA